MLAWLFGVLEYYFKMKIIKWPDHASLDDGSLGIRMELFVDISASRGLHQDKNVYVSKTLAQYIKYIKRQVII